ncbi:tail fiber assembly protein [Kluyvera ascorbata]|uniref:tail fiber assembly protein n=1 Tax=Kluyvera ascorbata TaxID=51288 RepID=UPI0039F46C1A
MDYFFSAKTLAFYPESEKGSYIKSGSLPDDVIIVSSAIRNEFNFTPPPGKQLGSIENVPAWVDVPPPTHEQLVALAERQKNQLRKTADSEIAWLQDAVDAGIATDEETTLLAAWKNYRVLLMRVDTSKAPDIEYPTPPTEQP